MLTDEGEIRATLYIRFILLLRVGHNSKRRFLFLLDITYDVIPVCTLTNIRELENFDCVIKNICLVVFRNSSNKLYI